MTYYTLIILQGDFGQKIARMLGVISTLLIFTRVQCWMISQMYEKVPAQNYSILSGNCEFYTPVHVPVRATSCGQMCITEDCFVFAYNGSWCAVCHYVETANQTVPSWETFDTVYKKRESIFLSWLINRLIVFLNE